MLFSSCFLFQLCSLFFFFKGSYIWGGGRHRQRQWQRNRDRERLRERNVGRNTESCHMWCGCEDTRVSIIIPVIGVRKGCELPAVGDGKWSPALWKRGRHLYYWATSPDPNCIFTNTWSLNLPLLCFMLLLSSLTSILFLYRMLLFTGICTNY